MMIPSNECLQSLLNCSVFVLYLCMCLHTVLLHAIFILSIPSVVLFPCVCFPVRVCVWCVSCDVWCVSVAFDKGTGWIASTLKPSTWPQRSTGNLNASFPFLLWKYLPLAGKNPYTSPSTDILYFKGNRYFKLEWEETHLLLSLTQTTEM